MQGTISFDGTLSGGITGGGGGGSEVTITPTLSSGTKIADYSIDSTPGELFAPTPEALTAQAPLSISSGVISIDLSGYQEKLTAGSYINIDSDNEISCTPPITNVWYTPEPDVQQDVLIGKFTVNDVTQNVYAPSGGGGQPIFLDANNVIQAIVTVTAITEYTPTEDCFISFIYSGASNKQSTITVDGVGIASCGGIVSTFTGWCYVPKGSVFRFDPAGAHNYYTVYGLK